MSTNMPQGQRFSLLYLRPDTLRNDSPRLRRRIAKLLELRIDNRAYDIGQRLERELGIQVVFRSGGSSYINWKQFLEWELRDVLDAITIVGRATSTSTAQRNAVFVSEANRVFKEESAAYVVDADYGVHPIVDAAFSASLSSAVRGLAGRSQAALEHVETAEKELLPGGNTRSAIRAVFDAVENLFKQMFPGVTHVNSGAIKNDLRPLVQSTYDAGVEQHAALKCVEAFSDWVNACHFFRHDAGEVVSTPPSEDLTVALVSQGLGHIRWLSDIRARAEPWGGN